MKSKLLLLTAIAHPTDARLTHRAIEKLVELAKREGVELRQSYLRLAKRAAIMVGRYTQAHQFKRARRELKFLRTRLGRIIRDIRRKIEGNTALENRFGPLRARSSSLPSPLNPMGPQRITQSNSTIRRR